MWQTYKIQVYLFTCLICLEILAIKHKDFLNSTLKVFVWKRLLLPFNEYLGVDYLDNVIEVGVIFKKLPNSRSNCTILYPLQHISYHSTYITSHMGLVIKNSLANVGDTRDARLIPGPEDPLEKEMATHSSILAGKSQGQRSLVGYSPWGCKELDTTEHSALYKSSSYSTFTWDVQSL